MYMGTIINNFLIISIFVTIRFLNTYYNDNKWDLKHVLLSSGNLVLGGFVTSFFRVLLFVTKCDMGRGSKIGQNSVTSFMDGPKGDINGSGSHSKWFNDGNYI